MRPFPWLTLAPLVLALLGFCVGLVIFTVVVRRGGRFRTARIQQHGDSAILSSLLLEYSIWFLSQPVRFFTRLRVHPDVISWLGLLTTLAAVPAIGTGHFGLGGWLFLIGGMLDSVDGTVARNLGLEGDAGEFLDAALDRVADTGVFLGLFWYYRDHVALAGLVGVGLCASTLISYMRAKAEAMGVDCPRVILRRPERVVYLGNGMALAPILAAFIEPAAARPIYHLTLAAILLVAVLGTAGTIRTAVTTRRALAVRDAAKRRAA
jgi:CDP-diacylglycerol--glycerol-3-phosphate 3-phosphatidyltransferase